MMKLLPILILFSSIASAEGHPNCSVEKSKTYEIYPNEFATINISVEGSPCYKANMTLEVSSNNNVIYSYQAHFKPHVSIMWDELTESDVKEYVKRALKKSNIFACSDLEPLEHDVFYVKPLVDVHLYQQYKDSNCKAFHHQTHYEASKTIVLPRGLNKSIPINEFGI